MTQEGAFKNQVFNCVLYNNKKHKPHKSFAEIKPNMVYHFRKWKMEVFMKDRCDATNAFSLPPCGSEAFPTAELKQKTMGILGPGSELLSNIHLTHDAPDINDAVVPPTAKKTVAPSLMEVQTNQLNRHKKETPMPLFAVCLDAPAYP